MASPQTLRVAGDLPGTPTHLIGSRCDACDRWEFPIRETCPACGRAMESRRLPAEGVVAAASAVLHDPPGAVLKAPYVVALVEIAGQIMVVGVVEAADAGVEVTGQRVTTVATEVNGRKGYAFRATAE